VTTDAAGKFKVHLWTAVPLSGTLVYVVAADANGYERYTYRRRAAAGPAEQTEPSGGQLPLTIRLRPVAVPRRRRPF
jgi:hypothetical protein